MGRHEKQLMLPLVGAHSASDVNSKINHDPVHVRRATFMGGLGEPVHRWFRLTPSFAPDLVRRMLAETGADKDAVVYDPFAGASTTLIEARAQGLKCMGSEINPFLHWVGQTSLDWDPSPESMADSSRSVAGAFLSLKQQYGASTVEDLPVGVPKIHNVYRWWRPDVLKDILLLKEAMTRTCENGGISNLLRLALAGVLVPDLTNVTLGRLQLFFIDRSADDIRVLETWEAKVSQITEDLGQMTEATKAVRHMLRLQDATKVVASDFPLKATHVITSPPYPNRYSYVWNTRPHLYMFNFFTSTAQASDLDKSTIGGTWGAATSCLAKGILQPEYAAIQRHVVPVADAIRASDNLMANYLIKYFNLLCRQILQMRSILADRARMAYVVGCSRLKGVYVETDVLLAQVCESLSSEFRAREVARIRRRHSGKELHESIVYVDYSRQ